MKSHGWWPELWRARRKGLDAGEVGLGLGFSNPSSFRALRMMEWRRVSGPKARRIISLSPLSWIRRKPMIFEAFSGSRVWIREKTTLVASLASMAEDPKLQRRSSYSNGVKQRKISLFSSKSTHSEEELDALMGKKHKKNLSFTH